MKSSIKRFTYPCDPVDYVLALLRVEILSSFEPLVVPAAGRLISLSESANSKGI